MGPASRFDISSACLVACCVALLRLTPALSQEAAPTGLQQNVVFDSITPVSGNSEILRRMVTPLAVAQMQATLARSEKVLQPQSIDLAAEKFVVYVPPAPPPSSGYALIVFIPPWQTATLPDGWASVLDQYHAIFVSAARSGNEEGVLNRRVPLALLAEQNIARRYPVDPQHIYIAGFSGGARVAMRVALGYPDIFRGALLDAGGDPIGRPEAPLPPADLFARFQEQTHLVYVTGDQDMGNLGLAAVSARSMRDWCVFGVDAQVAPRTAHEILDAPALFRAMNVLFQPVQPDGGRLASCRAGVRDELAANFRQVKALAAAGNTEAAEKMLLAVNNRFGGLAAPDMLNLATALKPGTL